MWLRHRIRPNVTAFRHGLHSSFKCVKMFKSQLPSLAHLLLIGFVCFCFAPCHTLSRDNVTRPHHVVKSFSWAMRSPGYRRPDISEFLQTYGYLDAAPWHTSVTRRKALRRFQQAYNLNITGAIDPATRRKLGSSRCTISDADQNRGQTWLNKNLSWRIGKLYNRLDLKAQENAFHRAFNLWENVSSLSFVRASAQGADVDVKIVFVSKSNSSRDIIHYPVEKGLIQLDENELWTLNSYEGTNLIMAAAHVIGHVLGLSHSAVPGAAMSPYYQGYDPEFQLSQSDIKQIQELYGSGQEQQNTEPEKSKEGDENSVEETRPGNPPPDICRTKLDAAFQGPAGRVFLLRGKWLWRVNPVGVDPGFPKLAKYYYGNLPSYVGAAAHSSRTGFTYFFKGRVVLKYRGYNLIERKRMRAHYPRTPQAAFMGRQGDIVLLKKNEYWMFDENEMELVNPLGQAITEGFPGLTANTEAAVRMADGLLYLFKGYKYSRYDEESGMLTHISESFIGRICPTQ